MTKKIALILSGLSLCLTACGGDDEDVGPNNNFPVMTNNLAVGMACTMHSQCLTQFCRNLNGTRLCANKLLNGSPCTMEDLCVDGSVCKAETVGGALKCLPPTPSTNQTTPTYYPKKNERCTDVCEGNLICEAFTDGFSYCRVPAGGYCNIATDCVKDYACKPDGAQFKCMNKFVGLGAECSNDCEADLLCEPNEDGQHSYCKAGAGHNCSSDNDCIKGYECAGSFAKTCTQPKLPKGEECLADSDCSTQYCSKPANATTTTKGKCDLFPVNHECTNNDECVSRICQRQQDQTKGICVDDDCRGTCRADETCTPGGVCVKDNLLNVAANDPCDDSFRPFCRKGEGIVVGSMDPSLLVRCQNNRVVIDNCSGITINGSNMLMGSCKTASDSPYIVVVQNVAYCAFQPSLIGAPVNTPCTGSSISSDPFTICYGDQIADAVCENTGTSYAIRAKEIHSCDPGKTCQMTQNWAMGPAVAECK